VQNLSCQTDWGPAFKGRAPQLSVLWVILCASLSVTAAFAPGGGMGLSHMSITGGAFGTNAAAPGTDSLGTALSSSGVGEVQ
jgi:hypothetical protein